MDETMTKQIRPEEFAVPVRNRYFYGKLLDVFHFELETEYMNGKRELLNRIVTGWGVACGLDVQAVEDGSAITITPGLALDQWGREIVVATSRTVPVPDEPWQSSARPENQQPRQAQRYDTPEQGGKAPPAEEEHHYHVVLCYHECQTGPAPVLAGDCGDEQCMAGTLEERYRIEIRPGWIDPVSIWDCHIPDAITRGELQYEVLVRWITDNCPELPNDPCVPLANIRMRRTDQAGYCQPDDIDINIRQLALSNRALFYLLMSMLFEHTPRRRR